jgi:glutamate-1-semialdehyde 2,1-aminomutase
MTVKTAQSEKLFNTAKTIFPGGVNSPVRAFGSVGGTPRFMVKGDGPYMWDADENQYIDFCCSWGPLVLGHNYPSVKNAIVEAVSNGASFGTPTVQENKLGQLIIDNNRFIDRLRFVSSGTEAVMSALRLARGFTGRSKVVKFEGCYHGHVDSLMVKAGSGLATLGTSSSNGIPKPFAEETIVLNLNDSEGLKKCFNVYGNDIAAVIIEPIPANNGLLLQDKSFLSELRAICSQNKSLLIFDEVISGFRVGFEGAAGYYNIAPDIITYGKIIGGGMPVGAYGAKKEIMDRVSPLGDVYQAGTLSGNPVAMAAGYAQLSECVKDGFYEDQRERTEGFVSKINSFADKEALDFRMFSVGSVFWFSFSKDEKVQRAEQINAEGVKYFNIFFHELLANGIYIGPSAYEVGFVSKVHSPEVLDKAASIICTALLKTYKK